MDHQLKSLRERIISGGSWAFTAKVVTGILTVGLTAIVARIVSPSDLGAFFLCFSVVTFLSYLARFGLDQVAVRLLAENITTRNFGRVKPIVLKVLLLNSVFLFIISIILWFGVGDWIALNFFENSLSTEISGLLILWLIVSTFQLLIPEIFRGFSDIRLASLFQGTTIFGGVLTGAVVGIILVFIWLQDGQLSLQSLVKITVFVGLGGGLFACLLLIKKIQGMPFGSSSIPSIDLLRIGGPLLGMNLSTFVLMQVDLWVLGALRSGAEVAIYGTASRVIKLITMPLAVTNEVVAPVIAELNVQNNKERLERTLRGAASVAAIPAIGAILLLFLFGGFVLSLLFGEFYGQGATILFFLGVGQSANVWAGSCGYTLIMTGHQKTLMYITMVSGLIAIIGCLMVASEHGAVGVAAMASLALIFQKITVVIAVKIHCQVWTHASPLIMYQEIRKLWHFLKQRFDSTH